MCIRGGYGNAPLTFSEVKAYADTVNELTPFDCNILVKMSRDYCNENAAATSDINRPAPHEGEASIEMMRSNVAKALKAMFVK